MAEPETVALVALLRIGRRPSPVYSELLESGDSAHDLLEHELGEDDHGQGTLVPAGEPGQLLTAAAADIAAWEAAGIRLLTILDHSYPLNLRAVHDRPPLLFVAGSTRHDDARSLAVIGSRTPSAAGIERAQAVAAHLTASGYTVVSGLAAGIDTAAHATALAGGGRTIAVLGTGLYHSYPPENAGLQRTITAQGAVVSQFWPDSGPSRRSFPMRNGVMSGLALGTIIVEASHTSGARVQARLALAHGRPVMIARQLLDQDWARALAARPGTKVFAAPEEITETIEQLTQPGVLEEA
jgi:DNA processing protein